MGKVRKGKKKSEMNVSKNELGKTKQNVQRFDLKTELKELKISSKDAKKAERSLKMPGVLKLEAASQAKAKQEGSSRQNNEPEVSGFMKTFMNNKLAKSATKKRKEHATPEKSDERKQTQTSKPQRISPRKKSAQVAQMTTEKQDAANLDVPKKKESGNGSKKKEKVKDIQKTEEVKEIEVAPDHYEKLEFNRDMFYIHDSVHPNEEDAAMQVQQNSAFKSIQVPDSDLILIIIAHDGQFALKGKYQLSSLYGTAQIYGYKINPKSGFVPVYSADNSSHLVITASLDNEDKNEENLRIFFTKNGLNMDLVSNDSCVFVIKELLDPMCNTITSIQPFKKLFSRSRVDRECVLSGIGVWEAGGEDRVMRIGERYERLREQFTRAVTEAGEQNGAAPRLVLAGGVNVGKSTLCRYLVNSALNSCESVMFLECDIGQTELTPPGCVSLSMLNRPLLGPPFTHLQANQAPQHGSQTQQSDPHAPPLHAPLLQYYVGHVTPADDPAYYTQCLERTVQHYHQYYRHLPLIVNTMGWNQGLGLMLMLDTLKLVSPTMLVQIQSTNEHRNYPALTERFVRQNQGWRHDLTAPADMVYERIVLQSVVTGADSHRSYSPSDHRDLALLAYLCGRPANPRATHVDLFGLVPFMVPWHAVGVKIVHTAVPYDHIMYALNASVVGLYVLPPTALKEARDPTFPKMIPHLPVTPCHMFGIIRGIDPVRKLFHLITPEPPNNLIGVNAFVVGAVKTPKQLLLRESGMGHLPYVDVPQMMQGLPRRRCHQRARLQNRD